MVHDSYVDQVVAQVQTKMLLRELAALTIETYVRCIRRFITRVGKPLAAVKAKDVEQYLLDMAHQDRSPGTRNVNLAAIRFALRACLRRDPCKEIQPAKVRRRSPKILSGSEVSRLLDATTHDAEHARSWSECRAGDGERGVNGERIATSEELMTERCVPHGAQVFLLIVFA